MLFRSTALGRTKPGRSVGYATSSVATAEIVRTNTINPVTALQGKVAGLTIQSVGSSGVTSSSAITIRGAKSIDKNNSPIFVVDGMILQEPLKGNIDGTDWGSQLKNLNPDDYESVTVLKGAAATALYGSRGANGAIVIVSKGGKFGKQGLGVELSQTMEMMDIYASPIRLQNVYGMGNPTNGFEGGLMSDGKLQRNTQRSFGPKMDGQMYDQYFLNGEATPYVPHPDNWKAFYQNGSYSNTNMSITGGNEKTSFRASYSYTDNKGSFKFNEFTRNAISFKFLSQLNKVFSVESGVSYAFSHAQNGASQGGWAWDTNLSLLTTYYMPRNLDLATYQEVYRDPVTHAVENTSPYGTLRAYLHKRDMNKNERWEQSLLSYLNLKAQITPWLDASIKGNYNYYGISYMQKEYGTGVNYSGGGYYGRGGSISGGYNLLGLLHSGQKYMNDDLTVDLMVAGEVYGNTESQSWSKGTNGGLVTPAFFAFSNSKNTIYPSYNYTPRNNMTIGLSGIVNLGWKEQVYLELTGRNDWLSTLTYPQYMADVSDNFSVFYPSANLSWIFNETFTLPTWMSLGKFRASVASVGMGTSPYKTTDGYGVFSQGTAYDPDRNSVLVANPNLGTVQNKSLKPEIQQSIELGLDLRFFEEKLNFDFTYYKTNTRNQILSLNSVVESGASTVLINAGNIQNQGIEIQIDGTPVRTKDFRLSFGGNFTHNKGKIIKLHEDIKEWQLMWAYDAGPEIWAYEGGDFGVITTPYNSTYGGSMARFNNPENANDPRNGMRLMTYWGAYGSPNPVQAYGWVQEAERTGMASTPEEAEQMKKRKVIGKVEPDFLAGFNTSMSYKSFDLYAQIDARVGGQFFSHTYKYAWGMGSLYSSLNGRDAEHGGIARTNYLGETVNDGIMLDAVFDEGTMAPSKANPGGYVDVSGMTYREAVENGIIEPMKAETYYWGNGGWGSPSELSLMNNTWVSFREINLGYRLPETIVRKLRLQQVRVSLSARNIGYLYNGLKDKLNPESISSNNPLTPFDIGSVPFSRTYSLSLNVKF